MKKNFFAQHESALNQIRGFSTDTKDFRWYADSVPCRTACPADTDIPGYLEAIYKKDFDKAYQINLEDNVFPEILGRVCSRPCEDGCRHAEDNNGDSLAICFSKRSSGDHKSKSKTFKVKTLAPKTNKKIAVIGSGVAGLTCARELKRFGHDVDVFEKHKSPGGMLNQGIPVFRLPRKVIEKEIKQITEMGIKIFCRFNIATQRELDILAQQYDAVVLAMGTLKPNKINAVFSGCEQVEDGLDFLLRTNEQNSKFVGKNVVVIGGGYTAMDCSRTALRLGASSVKTFYRRDIGDLVILPGELEELRNEKGVMKFNARPIDLVLKNNKLVGLELIKTKIKKIKGRIKLTDIRGSKFTIKTDHVILAIGQKQDLETIKKINLHKQKIKNSIINFKLQKNIFVAGDYALGATTLIDAIGHAKAAADTVDNHLMKRKLKKESVFVNDIKTTNRNLEMNYIPINKMSTLKFKERSFSKEVELGFNRSQSTNEASRCYLCHYKFEIDNTLCVLCDECLLVKPVENCIVETDKTSTHETGEVSYSRIDALKTNGIYHGKLYIDHKKCVRCGECERVCPTNAITIQKIEKRINAEI
tara:strand:+ start:188 stop:1951 length:1764 start_codon:yes stop_codon:yes gene_type:complete